MLMELAGEAPREIISILLASARVRTLPGVVEALATNPRVLPAELQALHGEPPLHIPLKNVPGKDVAIRNAADDQIESLPTIAQSVNNSESASGNAPKSRSRNSRLCPKTLRSWRSLPAQTL